ncbi:hypothetical protein HDV00_004451 [Rhizophlyctis rosea]|nr:hypothetical protein HDV00_004451 [Rhizophlyctis rosea]
MPWEKKQYNGVIVVKPPIRKIDEVEFKNVDLPVILRQDVEDLGVKGEIVMAHPSYVREYLIPFGLAYHVPRLENEPVLPDGWVPKVVDSTVIETILPAFSTISPEKPTSIIAKPFETSPSSPDPSETTIKHEAETIADTRTALESLPALEFHRVRISEDSTRIYGSVSPEDVATELSSRWGISVDKAGIEIENGRIKEVGERVVRVKINGVEEVTLRVVVRDFGEEGATA